MLSLTTLFSIFTWLERQTETITVRGTDELEQRLRQVYKEGFVVRRVYKDGDFFVVRFSPGKEQLADALQRQSLVSTEAKVA